MTLSLPADWREWASDDPANHPADCGCLCEGDGQQYCVLDLDAHQWREAELEERRRREEALERQARR